MVMKRKGLMGLRQIEEEEAYCSDMHFSAKVQARYTSLSLR